MTSALSQKSGEKLTVIVMLNPTAGVFTALVLHKTGSNQSWIRKEIMGPNPHYPQVIGF